MNLKQLKTENSLVKILQIQRFYKFQYSYIYNTKDGIILLKKIALTQTEIYYILEMAIKNDDVVAILRVLNPTEKAFITFPLIVRNLRLN